MVQRSKLKRIKRRAKDTQKSLVAILLIFGFLTMIFVSANARGFTAFISGTAVPFTGDISFVGMSVEGEEQRFDPVGQFTRNFDGVPDWFDYSFHPYEEGDIKTFDYPNLIGCPGAMPTTSWAFSELNHIDMSIDNPMIIEEDTLPSTFQVTDGFYTEVYRYSTDVFVRVHPEMVEHTDFGITGWSLSFIDEWNFGILSFEIGEYAPMYEVYAKVGISVDAVNESIVVTGADMAANGEPQVRFWPWNDNPDWIYAESYSLDDADRDINDNFHNGAIIGRDILQTGFDMSQGFNIVDKTEGRDSYYEFNVGFNYLGVLGYFYDYYDWIIFQHQDLFLYDMEVKIPVTFQIIAVYDLPVDDVNLLYDLYPELMTPGASVHIIGTGAIPENTTYGSYYPDNQVIGVYESIPGFEWLKGEFGAMAFVVMSIIIGVGAALLFRRK